MCKKNENLRIGFDWEVKRTKIYARQVLTQKVQYCIQYSTLSPVMYNIVYIIVVVDCDCPLMLYSSSKVVYSSSKAHTVVVIEWGSEAAEWLNILG